MIKLLVIEDHALVREGLVQTLRQLADEVEISAVADYDGAVALLENGHRFDLILLDLGLPGIDGLSCLKAFRKRYPATPVVILSAFDDAQTVSKAMKTGAASFVPKTYSSERLLNILHEVLAGEVFTPDPAPAGSVAILPAGRNGGKGGNGGADPADFGLSERLTEVLGLMASGKSNRDIAKLLGLTEGTVKVHMTRIFKALRVTSRTQAMVVVSRRGIKI